jgi:hypothetical protein
VFPKEDPLVRPERLQFTVRGLDASVPEGLPVTLQGQAMRSGRIRVRLDETAPAESGGVLDYGRGRAEVTFHVRLDFPEIADALRWAGLDGEEVPPARGVLRSTGDILADHSFALSGACTLAAHDLFRAEDLGARVLPGT